MTTLDDALRLIVVRSPRTSAQAAEALRATMTKRARYSSLLRFALSDPAAEWTTEERQLLADATVDDSATDEGDAVLAIRSVSADTRREFAAAARQSGSGQADYLRRLLVLREFVIGLVDNEDIDADSLRDTVRHMGI